MAKKVRLGLLKSIPSGYTGNGTNPIFRRADGTTWQGLGDAAAMRVRLSAGSWVIAENGVRFFNPNEVVELLSGWQTDL